MAFGADQRTWAKNMIEEVRRNLATVAQTIARFEPVVVCVRENEVELAKQYFTVLHNIEWFVCPLDDLWIRDYGAVFVVNESGEKAAVDFNFNGWGEKQDCDNDAEVAARMAKLTGVELLETDICLEGGGIEIDGEGTAIITESCVLNSNRNPDWTKKECERELLEILGLEKIIWLPGVRGEDITDGHTNVRQTFAGDDFCAGYINFYVCNDAVIATEFGDKLADEAAREKLTELFPNREIMMLNIDGIAAGGGGIHCATQQEPKV